MHISKPAPATLNDDYILDILDHLLPRYPKQAISHYNLTLSEITKRELSKRGATLVKFPDASKPDEAGWFVIHWPSLMRWLYTSPQGLHVLQKHGYGYTIGQLKPDTDAYTLQWTRWKTYLETQVLPPGAVNWADDREFRSIIEVFPDDENDVYYCSVFRVGGFLTWIHDKTFRDLSSRYRVFHRLNEITAPVYERLPILMQVLITSLRHAKVAELGNAQRGFTNWGIAWTRHGLFFHYGRALNTLQQPQSNTFDLFPDSRLLAYCASWLSPDYYTQRIRLPEIPPLSAISEAPHNDHKLLSEGVEPYYTLYPRFNELRRRDPSIWDSQHARYFPLSGKSSANLITFLEQCIHLSEHPEKIEALSRRKRDPITAEQRALYYEKRTHKTVRFSINALELAEYSDVQGFTELNAAPETLSMDLYAHVGTYYMSAPLELQADFAALFDKRCFARTSPGRLQKYKKPNGQLLELDIPRHKFEQSSTAATISINGSLFFHPELLKPGGEVDAFMDFLVRHESHRDKRSLLKLKWFKQFLVWLEEPSQFLEDNPKMVMGDELRHLVDPASPCPVKLPTRNDRLGFFWEKGMRKQHRELCWAPPQGKAGDRPPRLGNYDTWALWYGAEELLKLQVKLSSDPNALPTRVRLTPKQQAEFLAYRWLPWRTPSSLVDHLIPPNYLKYEEKQRLPTLSSDYDIKELVFEKQEEWGISYSQLAF
jgi:hypothetical protein